MKFKCIYADPPWQYKVYSKKGQGRSAENHYRTMSKEDIFSLPVSEIADEDFYEITLRKIAKEKGLEEYIDEALKNEQGTYKTKYEK